MQKKYFISGIGTDVGKTVVSAVLVQKLSAVYWKPIQTGSDLDVKCVKRLVSNPACEFLPSWRVFAAPRSPHEAAALEEKRINLDLLEEPVVSKVLIIEGAGGLLVPLNEQVLMFEVALKLKAEVILVSRNYLGSINHTLLSLDFIARHKIPFAGLIFCGEENAASEQIILKHHPIPFLGRIPQMTLNTANIEKTGKNIHLT